MRAVAQRVSRATVEVEGTIVGEIGEGLLLYIGVAEGDTEDDALWMADKAAGLRIFRDGEGMMNLSVEDAGGAILAVSQFTLLGDARKGKRPSWSGAASPEAARILYARVCDALRMRGLSVAEGLFRETMEVSSLNDGPVTILLDSRKTF